MVTNAAVAPFPGLSRIEPWHARSRRFRLFPIIPRSKRAVLERWERERTFERLRELNEGGPRFSFVDGPITANNAMGVHHAWGRTLKDVFQRYQALRGCELRYQNGFDCQGLWVEVEVEKSLGLNSKREIEEYGLAEFAARCRERVAQYAEVITEQSRRLGMWMDWDDDYYTFSDTNIEYIWRFLKEVHRRGWLFKGHRATQWCPRCGTSLSQHEQAGEGNYEELEHPSLYVRFPLSGATARRSSSGRRRRGRCRRTSPPRSSRRPSTGCTATSGGRLRGDRATRPSAYGARARSSSGSSTQGPFDDLPAQEGVVHRVIPWERGRARRGHRHRPHRARLRRRGLRALARRSACP